MKYNLKYPHPGWLIAGIALILALDLWTKHLASTLLTYGEAVFVLPVLDWTLLHNPGAAFSFLADAGGWQRYFFTAVSTLASLGFFIWMLRIKPQEWLVRLALMFIVSGALGNLIDRVRLGYVVDFIHFHWQEHYFPAFNVADMAISFGAILIVLDMLLNSSKKGKGDA